MLPVYQDFFHFKICFALLILNSPFCSLLGFIPGISPPAHNETAPPATPAENIAPPPYPQRPSATKMTATCLAPPTTVTPTTTATPPITPPPTPTITTPSPTQTQGSSLATPPSGPSPRGTYWSPTPPSPRGYRQNL